MQPLTDHLVVDLTRYLPGAFAARELRRLGARVVRVEPSAGDSLRTTAPEWHAALTSRTESVVCDLARDASLARALVARADIVLEGFRPSAAASLGVSHRDMSARGIWCSITGFGDAGRHAGRAGHDLNYLGWAGALEDTSPGLSPFPAADLAAGALTAVTRVLAALLDRERTGRGRRLAVSMTHGSHDLVAYRLLGDPFPSFLTGGLACYRIYETADGRHLTVAALERKFFRRLCELLGRPTLAQAQWDADQEALAHELATAIRARPLAEWLELFDDEDVCVGPVWSREEAAVAFGAPLDPAGPALGEHTEAWRSELGR